MCLRQYMRCKRAVFNVKYQLVFVLNSNPETMRYASDTLAKINAYFQYLRNP